MQKQIKLITLGLMIGMQMFTTPLAKSMESTGILATLGAGIVVGGVIIAAKEKDEPVGGTTSTGGSNNSSNGNSSSSAGNNSSSSGTNASASGNSSSASSSVGTNLSGESCKESGINTGFDKLMEDTLDVLTGGNSQIKEIEGEALK